MEESNFNDVINIILGIFSFLAIISGFFIEDYKVLFWSVGSALLIVVALGYQVFDNRSKIKYLNDKFKKIEESLNIYDRLNKLESRIKK